jgi:hypothetical protein
MKTASIQNKTSAPSPFQIAVLPEDFALPAISETAPPTSFADLMLHPEKLETALKIARRENDVFDASRRFSRSAGNRARPIATSKNNGARKPAGRLQAELKNVEFHLEAPAAVAVKLAADFTDWEKFPLDMIKTENGVWSIFVPLRPGNYSYRFIVDGNWCDDPDAGLYEFNPFGTVNAMVKVT